MVKRGTLSLQRIVGTATGLLDRNGVDKFSMRRLAAEIGVDPMALYHHVPNRAALMRELVRVFLQGCEFPAPRGTWQTRVRAFCRAFRGQAQRHPGLFIVYSRSDDWSAEYLKLEDSLYAALADAGFAPKARVRAGRLLLAYTENFALWELSGWIASYSEEERADFADNLAEGDFPAVAALAAHITDIDPDAEFEFGLDVAIRGLEAGLSRRTSRKGRRS